MALLQRKKTADTSKVSFISPDAISPNPDQPRKLFDEEALSELADSIRLHGILQPLTVRQKSDNSFELIAGERRLRAAKICGLSEVPCLIMEVSRESSCLLSIIENIQRRDLDFWEEALALERLISLYGLSQEEAATRVGKSQSAVANKLRLLRLSPEILNALRQKGFTERHARALLRLHHEYQQLEATRHIIEEGWNVAATEAYVESILNPPITEEMENTGKSSKKKAKASSKPSYYIKDIRFFLNSISKNLAMMKSAGVAAEYEERSEKDALHILIRIPTKNRKK